MLFRSNVAKPYTREALEKYNGVETASTGNDATVSENRPMLGVTVFTLTNVSDILPNGAVVSQVNANSNAQRGGIQVGDVIVEVNGQTISSSTELVSFIKNCKENDTLTVKVYRAPGMDQAITDKGVDLSGVEKDYSESYYKTLEVTLLNDKAA